LRAPAAGVRRGRSFSCMRCHGDCSVVATGPSMTYSFITYKGVFRVHRERLL